MGLTRVVILNDVETFKKFLAMEESLIRPRETVFYQLARGYQGSIRDKINIKQLLNMTSELATSFAIALAALTSWLLLRWLRQDQRTQGLKPPPGPRGIPLLGNLGLSGHVDLYRKCMRWANEYGPIFSIRMGAAKMVVLNDFPSVKTFYSMEESLNRPQKTIFQTNQAQKGKFFFENKTT
ncbi:putative cytochrome P450 [Ixodes scapularis]